MGNHLQTIGEVARRLDRLEKRIEALEIRIDGHLDNIRTMMQQHGQDIDRIIAAIELIGKQSPTTTMQWIYITVSIIGGGVIVLVALRLALWAKGGL